MYQLLHTRPAPVPDALTANPVRSALLFLVLLGVTPFAPAGTDEDALVEQRLQFREARKSLQAGSIRAYQTLADQLVDYPLYPYLLYEYYRPRLANAKDDEIATFLSRYGDLPMAEDLRRAWLRLLAQRGHWEKYLEHYTPQADATLRCWQLLARIRTGRDAFLLEDTRSLWLSGESLPAQCDPAFERLYGSDLVTPELVWQRITLAMEKGNTGLADVLSRRLPPDDRAWTAKWIAVHDNPARALRDIRWEDTLIARTILLHGMLPITSMFSGISAAITALP